MASTAKLPLSACVRLRMAIFIAGACVMMLQVLGTRIIGPHYGVAAVCVDRADHGDSRCAGPWLLDRGQTG